jgi:hypothetical protein
VGIYFGVIGLLIGSIITSIIAYFLNSYYSASLISYPTKEQLADIFPLLVIAIGVSAATWCITLLSFNDWVTLVLQLGFGASLSLWIYEKIKHPDYLEMKAVILDNLKKIKQ